MVLTCAKKQKQPAPGSGSKVAPKPAAAATPGTAPSPASTIPAPTFAVRAPATPAPATDPKKADEKKEPEKKKDKPKSEKKKAKKKDKPASKKDGEKELSKKEAPKKEESKKEAPKKEESKTNSTMTDAIWLQRTVTELINWADTILVMCNGQRDPVQMERIRTRFNTVVETFTTQEHEILTLRRSSEDKDRRIKEIELQIEQLQADQADNGALQPVYLPVATPPSPSTFSKPKAFKHKIVYSSAGVPRHIPVFEDEKAAESPAAASPAQNPAASPAQNPVQSPATTPSPTPMSIPSTTVSNSSDKKHKKERREIRERTITTPDEPRIPDKKKRVIVYVSTISAAPLRRSSRIKKKPVRYGSWVEKW